MTPLAQSSAGTSPALQNIVAPVRFDVSTLPPCQQLLAWRERVGQVTDVVPSRAQVARPFQAFFDKFAVGEFVFNECYSDEITLERTIARVSQDNVRGVAFHIFLEGSASSLVSHSARRDKALWEVGILAVDMNQPMRVSRRASRHITFMVPVAHVIPMFADPGMLHGRVLGTHLPSFALISRRVAELLGAMRTMPIQDRTRHLKSLLTLILSAFGAEAGLSGSKNALSRAAIFDQARQFVRLNLSDEKLSPETVINALGVTRPTVYRLFQHDGGLNNFIQNQRLRAAAAELLQFPGIPIKDVGYAFGFSGASAFARAFRRAFDMTPHDLRTAETRRIQFDLSNWV